MRLHTIGRRATEAPEVRSSWPSWLSPSQFGSHAPISTTWGTGEKAEGIGHDYPDYVRGGYKGNGIVFAVLNARLRLFTEARFQYQRLSNGRPGDLFGDGALSILERPWPGGTTGDLLARMEQHASLAGNAYVFRVSMPNGPDQLRVARPDWVRIAMAGDPDDLQTYPLGYLYYPRGINGGRAPVSYLPNQVAHYAPIPDPDARFRGMSWLTPIAEEVRADTAANIHKGKFFDNGATPNLVISMKEAATKAELSTFVDEMRKHETAENAYKTLWLANGASVQVVGSDLKQLDFKVTQGAGETRIAAAGGVPPLIVGLSEGLGAATYSNYAQARRAFADLWARPSWRQAAGALEAIVPPPNGGGRLWYDDRDIPFLQEDLKDDSDIAAQRAVTIRQLVDAGYEPASVVAAVSANDMTKLVHSGLYSVQLQPPGATAPAHVEPAA